MAAGIIQKKTGKRLKKTSAKNCSDYRTVFGRSGYSLAEQQLLEACQNGGSSRAKLV
jgi:hypothetical protein